MKKLLVAAAVAGLVGTANAQSAFEGFYGQIATGYENNQVSNVSGSGTENFLGTTTALNYSSPSQSFGGAPIVVGLGYNISVAPKWLVGIGVDYSILSQTSSTYNTTITGYNASVVGTGASTKVGNRVNIFITPSYEIDKDKLVYLKAGYSSVQVTQNASTGACINGTCLSNSQLEQTSPGAQTKTVGGYVLGLGYKQIISGGFYGFAEGNYMSYSKPSFSQTTTYTDGSGGSVSSTASGSLNSYQLLVGVGYRF